MSKTNYDTNYGDFKSIIFIGVLVILFQIGLFLTIDTDEFNITDTVYLVLLGLIGVFSFILVKSSKSKFEKSFIFLGIGYFCFLIGDIIFYYYEHILEVDPYPSPFDILFLIGYIGIITHFMIFKTEMFQKFRTKEKIMIILVPILVTAGYAVTSFFQWGEYKGIEFDIIWGSMFAIGSSVVFSISFIILNFVKNKNFRYYVLLPIGIIIGMIAEIWYYYLETFEAYYSSHVVNTIWIGSFLLIIYSLIKLNEMKKSKRGFGNLMIS